MPEQDELLRSDEEAGIFTWDMQTRILYGDSAVAKHFGLQASKVALGLPFEVYLGRVYAHDKSGFEQAIRDAIITRQPYRAEYRTFSADGNLVHVMALGRCFFSNEGEPVSFSGIIYPLSGIDGDGDDINWRLQSAHTIAKNQGLAAVAAGICGILSSIGQLGQDFEDDRPSLN